MNLKKIGVLNLLLVFVPVALILEFSGASELWVFATSCIAIIPLAGLMGKSTEMLAHRLGPGIGGLLNASFGNAAELIIALFALKAGHVDIVKASLTGSIIGNILLVLGASFLAGGMRFRKQKFNATAAGLSATLLAIAAIGLLVPAIFHAHIVVHHQAADEQGLSLEIALVLFSVYVLMLLFSLKTHKHLYNTQPEVNSKTERNDDDYEITPYSEVEESWSQRVAITVLLVATSFVAVMSELLVGAVDKASEELGWTHLFVGVIVVAIVGNAAEHSTAVLVAMKNHMDLSVQIAVGSGLQIALFIAPVLVFVGYLPGFAELDLVFSMLEVVAVAVSVLIVCLVAIDGESNWMEGLLLLAVYVILAIAFYHLPESSPDESPVIEQVHIRIQHVFCDTIS
jgi:Ca2+:H+ antiporter